MQSNNLWIKVVLKPSSLYLEWINLNNLSILVCSLVLTILFIYPSSGKAKYRSWWKCFSSMGSNRTWVSMLGLYMTNQILIVWVNDQNINKLWIIELTSILCERKNHRFFFLFLSLALTSLSFIFLLNFILSTYLILSSLMKYSLSMLLPISTYLRISSLRLSCLIKGDPLLSN